MESDGKVDVADVPATKQTMRVVIASLLGVNIVALIQLVSIAELSVPLLVAVYCFAFSTPLLARLLFSVDPYLVDRALERDRSLLAAIAVVGLLAGVAGLLAVIWHLSWPAALLFAVLAVACMRRLE